MIKKSVKKILSSLNPLLSTDKVYTNVHFRRIFTKNFNTEKVALGERNTYTNPPFPIDWIRVDWQNADYNINLSQSPSLPFKDNSKKLLYSAHMIEHLSSQSLPKLFQECYRILKPGGRLRLECPDIEKLIGLYCSKDEKVLNHFRKYRKEILIEKFGYPENYIEDHLSVLGEVSNYIVEGQWVHIPVYVPKEEFDHQLETLSLDDFCEWCISLQTPEQHKSGGHQSAIYFSKLHRMLEQSGFTNITKVDFGKTTIPGLELNGGFWSIKEKPHRAFYSLFVEATKP